MPNPPALHRRRNATIPGAAMIWFTSAGRATTHRPR
jgi:hypothetical protein